MILRNATGVQPQGSTFRLGLTSWVFRNRLSLFQNDFGSGLKLWQALSAVCRSKGQGGKSRQADKLKGNRFKTPKTSGLQVVRERRLSLGIRQREKMNA